MKKIYIIVLLTFGLLPQCKDALNIDSTDSYSETMVWGDLNLVEVFVNSKYRALSSGFNTGGTLGMMSAYSDEAFGIHNWGGVQAANRGEITPDYLAGLDVWGTKYRYIRDANMFFENIDGVPGDADLRGRLKGEMTFIRAYAYAELVQKYGGVPIITQVFELNDDYTVTRDSYEDCVDFIVTELDKAAALLSEHPTSDFGRATEAACYALKSRVLLYAASEFNNPSNDQAKWQKAADAAKKVIDMQQFSLYQGSNYNNIFLDPANSEVILTRPYSQTSTDDKLWIDLGNTPNGYGGWSGNCPIQNLVDDFEMLNGKMIDEVGSGYDPNNPYADRDPRFDYAIVHDGSIYRDREAEFFLPGGKDSQDGQEFWNASKTGYTMRKFMDENLDFQSNTGGQHWIFFRLTEIYLNYAEAMYHLGNEDIAREYINIIRDRASVNMPAIPNTVTGTDLLEKIRHERRIELVFEGHRYYDVRRWKIAEVTDNEPAIAMSINRNVDLTKTYTKTTVQPRKFLEQHYLLPIPQSEIDKNPQLTQNPGY